uniref:Major capsid protein N-terminal domain-containing protein n=1 Tax=viral metagenome TaxID=1070528 RepID=A0A6C0DVS5_9ZZZZ
MLVIKSLLTLRDKHYGDWLQIWNELTQTSEKEAGYNEMIGNVEALTNVDPDDADNNKPAYTLYIPLQFWFCRNPGLALPLIALQYHEVKFNITFRAAADCYIKTDDAITSVSLSNASLYIDYIYLDTDERRQFAQVQHEYLIEQLQFTGAESFSNASVKSKLALNHPCKELVWVVAHSVRETNKAWTTYSASNGDGPVVDAKLQLNGHDRFSTRKGSYFNLVQPYQHHTRIPSDGIYVYSFALNPEQHQPSGTVNMSRIDNATLMMTLDSDLFTSGTAKLRLYAVNYNVLRIMAGEHISPYSRQQECIHKRNMLVECF